MSDKQKEIFLAQIEESRDAADALANIAVEIMDQLEDREWAKVVFEKAIAAAEGAHNPVDKLQYIARHISDPEIYNDKEWGMAILEGLSERKDMSLEEMRKVAWFYTEEKPTEKMQDKGFEIYKNIAQNLRQEFDSAFAYEAAQHLAQISAPKELVEEFLSIAIEKAESAWDYAFISTCFFECGDEEKSIEYEKRAIESAEDEEEKSDVKAHCQDWRASASG